MPLDGKEMSIAGILVGWVATVFGFGRTYGGLSSRVTDIEKHIERGTKNPVVSDITCLERRSGCGRENHLQFQHGAEQFIDLKKLMTEIDKSGKDRHREVLKAILEIKSNQG